MILSKKLIYTNLCTAILSIYSSVNFAATQLSEAAIRGQTEYMSSCSACHTQTPQSAYGNIMKGVDWQVSRNAITNGIGGMGSLTTSDATLQDIAAFLRGDSATSTSSSTSTTTSGVSKSTFYTTKAILSNNEDFNIQFELSDSDSGDLYLAVQYAGQLLFLTNDAVSLTPIPIMSGATSNSVSNLSWSYSSASIPAANYPFYQVLVNAGSNPLDASNWIGELNRLNFAVRMAAADVHDADKNGFYDDDLNSDGFHDDDLNYDGYHDDDADLDGYHDDDTDFDGLHGATASSKSGQTLYMNNCARAGCHQDDPKRDSTYLMGAANSPGDIEYAVQWDIGGMGYLKNILTTDDYTIIAEYLGAL